MNERSAWRRFWRALREILEGTGADLNRGRPLPRVDERSSKREGPHA